MCFVVLYTVTSAPKSSGLCKTGVWNVLSTMYVRLAWRAIAAIARMSVNASVGFAGVSTKMSFVAGVIAERQGQDSAALAEKVVSPQNRAFLIPCAPRSPTAADPACARQFLSSVGRLLYRRPMRHEEVVAVVAKAGEAATRLKDFYAGLGSALEGLLLAPETLFIHDTTEPDPARPGHRRLDAYAMASRMSFFLWNAAPDDDLLRRAQRGELQTADGRAAAVDAMLRSQRLETGVRAFFEKRTPAFKS